MKRRIAFFSSLILAFSSLFFMSGCSSSTSIKGIHMTNSETISVPYGNFSYEGINVTVDFVNGSTKDIPLEENMISEVERLKFFKMGKQDVEVNFRNRFFTTMPVDVVFNKFKDTYALNGYECVYDGLPHYVTLNQELPEGASITYPYGNMFTNAGVYEIQGVMTKKGYETKTLTTTLTIHQAERDADGIVFEDTTLIYNGEMRTIEATNIPEGVEVTYNTYDYHYNVPINKVVNAGKYRVVAHFDDVSTNYKKIPDKEAILTIEKANYDLSSVSFEDVTKEYDGLEYSAKIKNEDSLPMGITPSYSYLKENGTPVTSNAAAGKYIMVCSFSGIDSINYNDIDNLTANLTVSKRVIKIKDSISFESLVENFDDEFHSIEITGTLPANVEVTYENNNKKHAGEYEVKAKFSAVNENETVDIEELTAFIIINKVRRAVYVYNDATQAYDKDFSSENISIVNNQIVVSGYDETVFRVSSANFYKMNDGSIVDPSNLVNNTTYQYVIIFEYIDEEMNDSVILAQESDNYTYIEA